MCVAVMHHITESDSRSRVAGRDGQGHQTWRPGPGLGSQSAQPVLEEPDGPGAAGRRHRSADPRGGNPQRARRRGADLVRSEQLGLVPDFVPPRLLGLAAGTERLVEKLPGARRLCAHNVVLARRP